MKTYINDTSEDIIIPIPVKQDDQRPLEELLADPDRQDVHIHTIEPGGVLVFDDVEDNGVRITELCVETTLTHEPVPTEPA